MTNLIISDECVPPVDCNAQIIAALNRLTVEVQALKEEQAQVRKLVEGFKGHPILSRMLGLT